VKTAVLVSRPFHGIVLQFMPNHVHDGPPSRQGLRACQCWKGRDDAKNEWIYVTEKDCPATGVTGPGRRLPPCPLYRPELRAVTACRDFRGLTRPR